MGLNSVSAVDPGFGALASLPVPATSPLGVVGSENASGGRAFAPFGYDSGPRGETAIGTGTRNPQPVFYAPLGTPVLAPITGTVARVSKLYSGDFSIMIAASPNSRTVWEVEHVISPKVKQGDRVRAGQPVAQVSDYDSKYTPGVGIVELGLLRSGVTPQHLCPFLYLDAKAKARIQAELTAILNSDAARGLASAPMSPVGCVSSKPIAG
jgi:biotin carboxyl carrier protein